MNWFRRIMYFGRNNFSVGSEPKRPECQPPPPKSVYNEFGLKNVLDTPPMPPCKPPRKSEKEIALERIRYLKNHLPEVRDSIQTHALDMAECSILFGKPHGLCLSHFDNLDRICRDVEMAIENIKGE